MEAEETKNGIKGDKKWYQKGKKMESEMKNGIRGDKMKSEKTTSIIRGDKHKLKTNKNGIREN